MSDIDKIVKAIDDYLEKNNMISVNPVEANEFLEKAGVLADSKSRKGLPLRRILRNGLIPYAYQPGGKNTEWVIPHSKRIMKSTPSSSKVTNAKISISEKANLLTTIFDDYIISTGKKEISLRTANEQIVTNDNFKNFNLKEFLEDGNLLQAYKTETKPQLWYIKFSEPDEYSLKRREYLRSKKSSNLNRKEVATNLDKPTAKTYIIGLIILFSIIGYCSTDDNNNNTSPSTNEIVTNSPWNSLVYQVESFLKNNYLKDPDSYESIEWSNVEIVDESRGFKYLVRHKFRAKNSFGGYVIENKLFYLNDRGEVIEFLDY